MRRARSGMTARNISLGLAAALALSLTTLSQASAGKTEHRAKLTVYCKATGFSGANFSRKKRRFGCYLTRIGFNTTYTAKWRPINLASVCRRQFGTQYWRYSGSRVYCIRHTRTEYQRPRRHYNRPVNSRPRRHDTVVKMCNGSHRKIYAVLARHLTRGRGWTTQGWYAIRPGGCARVNLGTRYRGPVYLFASNRRTKWSGGDAYLCVERGHAFRMFQADRQNCDGGRREQVGMTRFSIRPGVNTWKFRG